MVVSVGHDTEVNAALDRWGAISGIVTAEASGHPLADVCVRVSGNRGRGAGWTRTRADGSYLVQLRSRLPQTGTFKVRFFDCIDARGYIPEFYDDVPDKRNATVLTVDVGQTLSGIDAALGKFGVISGRVTDDVTAEPIVDACVNVFDELGGSIGSARTASDGTYAVGGLFTGVYTVRVRDCVAPTEYHVQWYLYGENVNEADPVAANVGSTVGHIDFALVPTTAFTLSVSTAGSGGGKVSSQPGGIDCGSDCSQDFLKGTQVTLTATPDAGSMFVSWSGACSGAGYMPRYRWTPTRHA